jgi:sugar O-acyltransferase (sialic acid O-acetyltransferase NeuD family)
MKKDHKLIIIGDSAFAEIAYEYFTHDSNYEVVAFSVEREYLKRETLFGLPIVPFETIEETYTPSEHSVYAALVYTQMNRLRTRMSLAAKAKGYSLASYVSSRAFLWRNVEVGEHCFIFEDNTVQPFVKLDNNVVLWSGNHIGHHSTIKDNCFISSQVVISGFVEVGENCFLGVNSTIVNNVKIGRDCWLGPNVTIVKDTPEGVFYKPNRSEMGKVSTLEYFKVAE